MYRIRNLYRKSSFRSCPYTVLVKCPVRFYSIFGEIGQNVDGKMYFYHKSHCLPTTTESPNGSVFSSLGPASGYAQKNCAERFSALKAPLGSSDTLPRSRSLLQTKMTTMTVSTIPRKNRGTVNSLRSWLKAFFHLARFRLPLPRLTGFSSRCAD